MCVDIRGDASVVVSLHCHVDVDLWYLSKDSRLLNFS